MAYVVHMRLQERCTSQPQQISKEAGGKSKNAASIPRKKFVYPPGEQSPAAEKDPGTSSTPTRAGKKACHLTVAQCQAESQAARARLRIPSPMPPSPPHGTTRSRPPRPRQHSSPPTLNFVPPQTVDITNIAVVTEGDGPQLFTMNLDAILNKLTPIEQGKYLRAKVEVTYLSLIDNSGNDMTFCS